MGYPRQPWSWVSGSICMFWVEVGVAVPDHRMVLDGRFGTVRIVKVIGSDYIDDLVGIRVSGTSGCPRVSGIVIFIVHFDNSHVLEISIIHGCSSSHRELGVIIIVVRRDYGFVVEIWTGVSSGILVVEIPVVVSPTYNGIVRKEPSRVSHSIWTLRIKVIILGFYKWRVTSNRSGTIGILRIALLPSLSVIRRW